MSKTTWTVKDLEKLEKAYKTGTVEVQYENNQRVRYRSLADMRSLIEEARNELGLSNQWKVPFSVVPRYRR
jgi:hypothetical protein